MFELIQAGHGLVEFVTDAKGAITVYQFGKQQYDNIQGFIGKKQMENAAALNKNTAEKLKDIPADRLSEPSPNKLTPLLEGAIQESQPELQDLWAALLANSMLDGGKKVRREYLDVVKKLEPIDVIVLNIIRQPLPIAVDASHPNSWQRFREDQRYEIDLGLDEWLVSCRTLAELGCVTYNPGQDPHLTPFARMFLAACEVR